MKVSCEAYVIATKERPIQFEGDCAGSMVDDFEDAFLYRSVANCQAELNKYDEPDEYEILPVRIELEY